MAKRSAMEEMANRREGAGRVRYSRLIWICHIADLHLLNGAKRPKIWNVVCLLEEIGKPPEFCIIYIFYLLAHPSQRIIIFLSN